MPRSRPPLSAPLRLLLLVLLLATACHPGEGFGPAIPTGMVPYSPSQNPLGNDTRDYYPIWWANMEACSLRHGELANIQWFYWPDALGPYIPDMDGPTVVGHYDRARNAIELVERGLTDQLLVEHEMLHALLPHAGHPAEFDRCGVRLGSK